MNRAAAKPRRELISKRERRGRASGGRENETRGREEWFDGTKEIPRLHQFEGRSDRYRRFCGHVRGQHESNRSDERAFRIVTSRHGASHHPGHFVTFTTAIHVIRGRGGSFLVMMRGNFALAGHAAG